MRLLILGGTGFIGPHQVRYALERGHTVTLFNRGRTNPGLFPTVEHLGGDRNDNLSALEGREWDAVIDNSASVPRWVRQSAGLLKDSVRQYLFVSSISVFSDFSIVGLDENGPLHALEDPTVEQVTGETYGGMKALCEWEAEQALPGRATVVRPGLIAGPGDPTNRFTYWPVRIDEGGEVMAPGEHGDPVQFIDARDLSEWMVRLAEDEHVGIYNATGPGTPLSMAEMLYGIRAATASPVTFTWVDAEFLQQQDVRPWQHMTVWFPPRGEMAGFASVNCSKAIADGLTFRPLAVTAGDTMHWYKGLPDDHRARHTQFGLPREREREVLAAWHARGR
ncbi:MAG TPA: NAD-dependent epimerase/dehydratase family protein [Gemmatimonadales bacterium]